MLTKMLTKACPNMPINALQWPVIVLILNDIRRVQVPPPALKQIIQNKHLNQKLMAVNSPIISIKYRKLILYVKWNEMAGTDLLDSTSPIWPPVGATTSSPLMPNPH